MPEKAGYSLLPHPRTGRKMLVWDLYRELHRYGKELTLSDVVENATKEFPGKKLTELSVDAGGDTLFVMEKD